MAAGDITPSVPRQDTGLTLKEIIIRPGPPPHAVFRFRDGLGTERDVVVSNGRCVGFNYATGETVEITSPTLFNTVRTAMLKVGGIKDAVDAIRAAGAIVVTGTTGS